MKGVLYRMINTHEINLNTSAFNRFVNSDYVILQSSEIEVNDYILFKQVETVEMQIKETGLYRMTQVKELIHDDGLKEGYVLVIVNKI